MTSIQQTKLEKAVLAVSTKYSTDFCFRLAIYPLYYLFSLIKSATYFLCLKLFSLQGVLSDGTQIAVKQLSAKSKQGNREFVNEIGMISALQHPNLVRLYGCCIEGKQLLLVYEYMENNSPAHVLFGRPLITSP